MNLGVIWRHPTEGIHVPPPFWWAESVSLSTGAELRLWSFFHVNHGRLFPLGTESSYNYHYVVHCNYLGTLDKKESFLPTVPLQSPDWEVEIETQVFAKTVCEFKFVFSDIFGRDITWSLPTCTRTHNRIKSNPRVWTRSTTSKFQGARRIGAQFQQILQRNQSERSKASRKTHQVRKLNKLKIRVLRNDFAKL